MTTTPKPESAVRYYRISPDILEGDIIAEVILGPDEAIRVLNKGSQIVLSHVSGLPERFLGTGNVDIAVLGAYDARQLILALHTALTKLP